MVSAKGRQGNLRVPLHDLRRTAAPAARSPTNSPESARHDSRTLSAFSNLGTSASCWDQGLFPVAASQVAEL
eukprot:6459989-Amphidinium_carterae.1